MSFQAFKLTAIKRLFYVAPKEFLLWLYFGPLKNRKHLRYILFHKLINDVSYVIRHHDKDRSPSENQEKALRQGATDDWWKKDFYQKNEFHWRCIRTFMSVLSAEIRERKPFGVIDIGCANGGRIDILADENPESRFWGLDFVVDEAKKNNQFKNAVYTAGYPLDSLKEIDAADFVFSSQSLLHALPKELEAYFKEFERLGVKTIAIMDSNINGYNTKNDGKLWSKHMGYGTGWAHNYSGYFKKYGYEVTYFKNRRLDFHPSRHDFFMMEIVGRNDTLRLLRKSEP